MSASPHVFDASQATFEAEVITASLEHPVLVDFWAPWCGPCKALTPILEKVVASYNGTIKLAKVNTDEEMALAGMVGIRSLPTVILFRDGQMIDGFTGALPEAAVREFIARHLGALPEAAAEEAPEPPPSGAAETPEAAVARLQQAIAAAPDAPELKLDLALAQMQAGNAEAAEAELDALPAQLAGDAKARRLRSQLDFARALKGAPTAAELNTRIARNAADFEARDLLGVRLLLDGNPAAGLDQFLHVLRADRNWNEGLARKRLIAAFSVLDDEELVGTYRRQMSSLLF